MRICNDYKRSIEQLTIDYIFFATACEDARENKNGASALRKLKPKSESESKSKPIERIKEIVDDQSKYTDWDNRADIKAALKMDLIIVLDDYGYPPDTNDEVFKEIFEQAENFKKHTTS